MLLLLLIHPPQTHEFMSCSPGSVAVWKHSAPCTYWIAKVLCCVWVLSCASWFCPWLLQDKKKDSSSFHPLLTGHNEGEKPPSQCAAYILWLQHVTHPYRESFFYVFDVFGFFFYGLQRLCRFYRLQDKIWGGDNLRMRTASLPSSAAGRSLKLWPNRWVLRTFSPSSSEAASSQTETRGAAPETWWIFLQNRSRLFFLHDLSSWVKHISPPYYYLKTTSITIILCLATYCLFASWIFSLMHSLTLWLCAAVTVCLILKSPAGSGLFNPC